MVTTRRALVYRTVRRGGTFAAVIAWLLVAFVIHELGHYVAARVFDVRVEGFVIGQGPIIASTTAGETRVELRLLPIGAANELTEGIYVEDKPMDSWTLFLLNQEPQAVADLAKQNPKLGELIPICHRWYSQKDPEERLFLVLAGPIANILAATLLTIIAMLLPVRTVSQARPDAPRPFAHDEPLEMYLDALLLPVYFLFRRVKSSDLCGPLGVLDQGERLVCLGLRSNLALLSSLCLAIGIFNLVPVAPLDGGKLLFIILEMCSVAVSHSREALLSSIGAWVVYGVLFALVVRDLRMR